MWSEDDPDRILASNAARAAMSGHDLAKVLGAFRKGLIAEGFPQEELAELSMEFFRAMVDPVPIEDD